MIKSNTNMEEIGKLVSPRPPEDVIHVTWTDWMDFRRASQQRLFYERLIRDSMKADSRAFQQRLCYERRMPNVKIVTDFFEERLVGKVQMIRNNINASKVLDNSDPLVEIVQWIMDELERPEEEYLEERVKLFIFLFALFLFIVIAHSLRDLGRPERGKISCINVYLLGNDGAHAYNGNGILFSRQRKSIRYALLDEEDHSEFLSRTPSEREFSMMAKYIGKEYEQLAYSLGLSSPEIDHIKSENDTIPLRMIKIFIRWKNMSSNSTFGELKKAFDEQRIRSKEVFKDIDKF